MEWRFTHVPKKRQQRREAPGVQRRMGMAAHVHHHAQERIAGVVGV